MVLLRGPVRVSEKNLQRKTQAAKNKHLPPGFVHLLQLGGILSYHETTSVSLYCCKRDAMCENYCSFCWRFIETTLSFFGNAAEIKVTQSLNKTNISYQLSLLSALLFPMTQVIAFAPRLIHHRTPATKIAGPRRGVGKGFLCFCFGEGTRIPFQWQQCGNNKTPSFLFCKNRLPHFSEKKEQIHAIHIFQGK